ncbi:YegS/Rv2252/BmrU family lipid kinase [Leptolyngbya sp. FACHB-17]|uniref:YegS/Rv2252/BmrU family lipid kinase n=1 Tax=unclassified Leptolyngbya TaxID=2650499 RepID=UPI0016814F58|nr:YegS/Rv2252/BmrU family lipid kinase [Leptolyngbya sp. FACHB-17]MBD2081592.1 YegS/Rv2252/BmrU family lipid kinase [Leptolyngbya sp. FACHB-17]
MQKAHLIFNPVAGQGNAGQELELIQRLLGEKFDLETKFTSPDRDADELAAESVKEGVDALFVSGGDGTVSAAANAVIRTQIPLGVIARGTANAFANALSIPTTIEAACETILNQHTKVIDVAFCNKHPMILLAGIGFEAETIQLASREAKNRLGILAYVLAGIRKLRDLDHFEAEVETDDKIISFTASALTVANAAPATSVLAQGPAGLIVDDGMLDLTIVAPANRTSAIAATYHLLQSALSGNPAERDDIGYLRSKRFRITTNPPQKVVLDGEMIGTTPIEVECVPAGLTVFMNDPEAEIPTEKIDGLPDLVIEPKDAPV